MPHGEDLVRISKDDEARLGQDQIAASLREQRLAERPLQGPNLSGNRRLRQMKLLARRSHAAFLCDHPEVQQVVVVQPSHGLELISVFSMRQHGLSICRAI